MTTIEPGKLDDERELGPEAASGTGLLVRLDETALTVAMTVVPGLYSRNKMFSLFTDARIRRARKRAMALRLAVRQLGGGGARNVTLEPALEPAPTPDQVGRAGLWRLVYEMPRVAYARRLLLTEAERACIVYLLARVPSNPNAAGSDRPVACSCRDEDRAIVERTLAHLIPAAESFASRASGDR